MKEKLLSELRKKTIPNFEVFKTKEAFEVLPQLLEELLQTERDKFITLVEKENTTLVFEDFVEFSELDYLRRILNHIDSCYLLPELRDIISNFRPKLEDLINEESYSKPYYEKLLWLREYYDLSQQQRRIIDLRIKKYEQRGIALDEASQERLKELNKQYSQYSEKFQHNVIDDQSSFSYHIDDESAVQEVPKSSLEKAKRLA